MKVSLPITALLALASSASAKPTTTAKTTKTSSITIPTSVTNLCNQNQVTQIGQTLASYGLQDKGYTVGILEQTQLKSNA
ncbi:MAG: hypothetical protein RLZZ210_92 [Pseudomonadota bacterium]|jgi:hypothetical protein